MICPIRPRLFSVLLIVITLWVGMFPGMAQAAAAEMRFTLDSRDYFINGTKAVMDTAPMIVENRTLMPISYVANPLGAKVEWNEVEQKVSIALKGQTIELWIGKNIARLNGQEVAIDSQNAQVVPVIIAPGRTMLPLRFIATALGASLNWNEEKLQITITYPAPPIFNQIKPSPANIEATKNFASYVNGDLGFGLKYPNDWTLMEKVAAFAVLLKSSDYNNVVTVSIFTQKDLDQFVSSQLDNFRKTMSGFILVESSSITISGLPAHKLVYTYNSDVGVLKLMSIYVAVNGRVYMITYAGQVGDFKTNLPTGELIINSLTI